jgi:hypothetical protein
MNFAHCIRRAIAATIGLCAGASNPRTYCVVCHDSRVYTRGERLARDYPEIRAQVRRWQHNIGLQWDDADIERVTNYIASKFYRLRCPEAC